jgi:ATP-binding cassette, subfamily B (MDR/TAP), member 1
MITVSKAAAAAHELFQTIDRQSKIDSLSDDGATPESCDGTIQLSGVTFAYPSRPDVPVLKSLDLSVPAGRTTAIVGASGSGKSTIVGLLERWFDPLSGTITLDGKELSTYNIRWLRTRIRLVQQVGLPTGSS